MPSTNILCIEDEEIDYRILEKNLENLSGSLSCHVDWAKDFDDGLSRILDNRHDLYFVDYKLHSKDGITLIRMAQEKNHKGPFIILTGKDDLGLAQESLQTGVYDYLLKKDMTPSVLHRTITYALERKRIENDLREEKEFSSFIVSEIPYLVVSVNRQGLISSVNPSVSAIMGMEPEALIGAPWKEVLAPENRDEVKYKISDDGRIGFDARLVDSDGNFRHIYWHVLNKKLGKKEADSLSFVLSGEDMTHKMEVEAQERQRQKTEALGHLAGGVAHEINNLLQPILFSADIIQGNSDDEKTKLAAQKIIRNTQSAAKIVDDILTYARKDTADHVEVSFVPTLQVALEFLEEMIPETIDLDVSGLSLEEDYQVCLNSTDVLRVIKNLILNASDAMGGEGKIEISCDFYHQIEFNHTLGLEPGRYVRLCINDGGEGIPADVVSRIYDPFFTTKDTGQGTGLGLSIVYNIVKNWKGGIDVETSSAAGTRFLIYIPISEKG